MSGYGKQKKGTSPILLKGQSSHGPIPYLNKPGQAQGTHSGKGLNKGGRVGKQLGGAEGNTRPVTGQQRFDQSRGYYQPDMGMRGGAMYNKGGRVKLGSGTKKETWKEKKKRKRKELSQQVSRETIHEAIKDVRSTKGKVHSIKRGQEDSAERVGKIINKQQWFTPEAELKKNFGNVRDKGWGGKHKKKEHN